MAPVETNATLTEVRGGGSSEEPGSRRAAGADAAKFAGEARVYYREKRERVTSGQGSDVIVRRTLIVDSREGIDWHDGDEVDFTPDDRPPAKGTVQTIEAAQSRPYAGSGVETTRVELDPA